MPTLMLIDNGSRRPESTLALRRLAHGLSRRLGAPVHPVSLLHSDQIAPELLGGLPAATLAGFLDTRRRGGERSFLALPLFFGPSRALTQFVPDTVAAAGGVEVRLADVLCPLPAGEPGLLQIIDDNLRSVPMFPEADAVVLVDHGSPQPAVTAVRNWLADGLSARLGGGPRLRQAVMERRAGARYDFNGSLLEEVLAELALEALSRGAARLSVVVAMQFIAPGRHAGPGGDVEQICAEAERRFPVLRTCRSRLVGEHPGLLDLLEARARQSLGH